MLQFPLFRPQRRTVSQRVSFQSLRSLLAIGLAGLLFLAPLTLRVSAQGQMDTPPEPKLTKTHQFTIYQDENGNTVCREATLTERIQNENINTTDLGLHQINHLKPLYDDYAHSSNNQTGGTNVGAGLKIILRGTTQLDDPTNAQAVAAKNAFNRAAQNWEDVIMSPVTIYIDVDYGSTNFGQAWQANVIGSTSLPSHSYPFQSVRTNMLAEASGEGNASKQAAFNLLPSTSVTSDLGTASTADVPDTNARALGLINPTAQSTDTAAKIAFNSNFSYDFDPTDGITPGQTDFDAVATHEIGHALGFDSDAGEGLPRPAVWDLYRFRTGTTVGGFTAAQRIMTIGGSPDALQFFFYPDGVNAQLGLSTGGPDGSTTNGGDGWQSSHWKHMSGCDNNGGNYIGIMDPAISSGCRRSITAKDKLAATSFGFNLTNNATPPPPPPPPPPPANDNFANAQVLSGCSGSVTGTNISATKEANEPNNPDSSTSTKSVWYQWTAPSTGSVTIDTHGSEFDTVLAVYTGNSLNSLSLVAHNDDTKPGSDVTSTVTFNATQGTVYQITVNGYNNSGDGGDTGGIKLNWTATNCTAQTTPTITWSNPADITYGTALSSTQLNATASTAGTFTYNPPAGTVLNAGTGQTLSVSFTPTDTTNFTNASKSVTINVLKATPVITWATPANILTGTALSGTQLNATANVLGTFVYTPAAGTVPSVGTNTLSVTFTPTDTANYTTATKSVSLTVDPLPTIQLSAASYSFAESVGQAQVTVTRTGNTSAASTVNYATSDTAGLTPCNTLNTGAASSRCDYATTIGTLQFAAGDTSKTIFIPIVDDAYVEGNETFTITLSSAQGATLGTPASATITITDNDTTTGANPIDNTAFFVNQHYIDFLSRVPDAQYQVWQNILNNCPPSGKDANGNFCDRIEVSADFFRSEEFQTRGYFVYRFYKFLPSITDPGHPELGHIPLYNEFAPDLAKVSGAFATQQDLDNAKNAFVADFMSRTEFKNTYGSITDPTTFVNTLLQTAKLTTIDPTTKQSWINQLTSGQMSQASKAQVLTAIVNSTQMSAQYSNEAFVLMEYFGYLRRTADAQYFTWLTQMNADPNNYRAMVSFFLNSAEYRQRFGP